MTAGNGFEIRIKNVFTYYDFKMATGYPNINVSRAID